MSYDDQDGFIWYDGAFVPWRECRIHVLSHGLHYASSVFEGARAYGGKIFRLQEHIERFLFSGKTIGMPLPFSAQVLMKACKETLLKQKLIDAYVRPIAWRGSEQMGVYSQKNTVHVAIACWAWGAYFQNATQGIKLMHARYKRPSPETAPSLAKTSCLYSICTICKDEAEAKGFDDALMLDYQGYVAEATGANIFFINQDKEIHTPKPYCFLDGITRRAVIALANKRGYRVIERLIKRKELKTFDQCFVTGTAAEVTPVLSIDNITYKNGTMIKNLIQDYKRDVLN